MEARIQNNATALEHDRLTDLLKLPPKNGLYKQQEHYGNGVRMVHMTELFANRIITSEDMPRVTLNDDEADGFSALPGDILIARRSIKLEGVAKATLIGKTDEPLTFESSIIRLRPNTDVIHPEFLLAFFESEEGRRQVLRVTRQVAVSGIAGSDLKDIFIPILPVSEQGRIAAILRTWDEAIDQSTKLIEARQRQHLALTHQLVFGQRRLGNFASSTEKTEHRWFELPADWRAKPIGKIAREVSERNGDRDVAEVLSCTKYDGFVRSLGYFKKQVFSDDLSGYKAIRRGDFGFPSNHVEEGSIGLQNIVDVGLVSPIYTIFRFDPKAINNDYAYAVLKTSLYRHIFEVSTSASVDRRGSLRWKEFAKIPFPVPPLAEQEAISAILAANKKILEGLKAERDSLQRQKRGLMQKLLTGKWRVKSGG